MSDLDAVSRIYLFIVASSLGICLFLMASREVKMIFALGTFLVLLLLGIIQPTGVKLAGLGVFLAGFALLYRAMMEGAK